jgi:pimeloyl-ACP methyl ester carboxylesterase
MDDTTHAPGEAAASARAVADVLGHLASTTEQMHRAIARRGIGRALLPPPLRRVQDLITTVGYGAVRVGIAVAGSVAAVALDSAERTRAARPFTGTARGRRFAGIVEGAFGDRLAVAHPALTGPMRLRVDGADVALDPVSLARHYPAAAPSVVVLLHGVIETEEWWAPRGGAAADFGTRLTRDLGCTCVQVRYNSGRRIADNGAALSDLLEELVAAWPVPVRSIALVGHSMGGLVARSAVHQAGEQGLHWPRRVRHVVGLGTPHTGAPLERGAESLAGLLGRFPESAPIGGLLASRSAGIKDLRDGWIHAGDRGDGARAYRPPVGTRHSNLAATWSRDPGSALGRWTGDLLVQPRSALAALPATALPARAHAIGGLSHRDLLTHDAVYVRLLRWLRD